MAADAEEVDRAIVALIAAPPGEAKRAMLERERRLLLSQTAPVLLSRRMEQAAASRNEELERLLLVHRTMVQRAREVGVAAAWTEFEGFRSAYERMHREGLADSALAQTLEAWLGMPTSREAHRFLDAHREILGVECDTLLMGLILAHAGQGGREGQLRDARLLLRDVRARGEPMEHALREAYVNARGGLSLDLPDWLIELEPRLAELSRGGRLDQTATAREALLHQALAQAEHDRTVSPETLAELHRLLADALGDAQEPGAEVLTEEIAHDEAALRTYTLDRFPSQYARVQLDKGNALVRQGERTAGAAGLALLRQAVAAFDSALCALDPATNAPYFAAAHNSKGIALARLGERTAGTAGLTLVQQAVAAFDAALAVLDPSTEALSCARAQLGKGSALSSQGEATTGAAGLDILQRAVAAYDAALAVLDPAVNASTYARAQMGRGNGLARLGNRTAGASGTALLQQALAAFDAALAVLDPTANASIYARVQLGKGAALSSLGEETAGTAGLPLLRQAVAAFDEALSRLDPAADAPVWATVQYDKGIALADQAERTAGAVRLALVQQALLAYDAALGVHTLEGDPGQHRNAQLNKASLAVAALAPALRASGDATALRRAYVLADTAYTAARKAQAELGWLESDSAGKARLRGEWHGLREMYAQHAWCLMQLGELRRAMLALEAGRAQALTEGLAIAGAALEGLSDAEILAFVAARARLEEARQVGTPAEVQEAHEAFLDVRRAIRQNNHPDFLPDEPAWDDVAGAAPDLTLLYLAATDFGGLALVLPPRGDSDDARQREPVPLELPNLTWDLVDDWLLWPDAARNVIGGWRFAIGNQAVQVLENWRQNTLQEQGEDAAGRLLHLKLTDVPEALPPTMHTLKTALERTLRAWRAEAKVNAKGNERQRETARLLEIRLRLRLGEALRLPALESQLGWFYTEAELEELLPQLSRVVMQPLREKLDALGMSDPNQPVALVPCGRLGALPLHAAEVQTAGRRKRKSAPVPFQETCELSYQASARSLGTARGAADLASLGPFLTVGDPPTELTRLPYARREAQEIAHLAQLAGREGSQALVGDKATLPALVERIDLAGMLRTDGLQRAVPTKYRGAWVLIASHGSADPANPTKCYMLLAHGDKLTLSHLQRERILAGVRCFIASGCVTSVGDLETAPDELSSFAAGALQAGAASTLATQWSVSDTANYLLMLRTAKEALAHPDWRPARALREAARWLRAATDEDAKALQFEARKGLRVEAAAEDASTNSLGSARGDGEFDVLRGAKTQDSEMTDEAMDTGPTEGDPLRGTRSTRYEQLSAKYPFAHPIYWASTVAYGA